MKGLAVGVGAAVAALAGSAAAIAGRSTIRRALPPLNGTLDAPGLAHRVTVRRDEHGVPHLRAWSVTDAAHAMGILHAQDRLFQLDLTRHVAGGRLSEIAGAAGVKSDRFIRRVGLNRLAEREAASLDGEPRAVLEAYAAGVNHVLETAKHLPLEYAILRTRPRPWTVADSILAAKILNLSLAANWDIELQRLELLRAIGPERAAQLDLVYPDTNPTILADTLSTTAGQQVTDLLESYREATKWMPAFQGGSNSWVVDGTLTGSGKPLLCNDPHLAPLVPSVWYQTHIDCGPDDFASAGVTLPGLPFVVIGHNRTIAWGYTNSYADVQDLVVEEFDSPTALRYRTEDGWEHSAVARETIRVKGGPSVVETVLITRHGPVVEPAQEVSPGVWRGMALQWTAWAGGNIAEAMLAIQRAGSWDEFRHAHDGLDGPSQNAVYADTDGHIGYFLTGKVPRRSRRPSGLPVPGWTGEARWEGTLGVDEVPQSLDPASHLLVTANNRIVGGDFPHPISIDYMNGYRALRISELLAGPGPFDHEAMRRIQSDLVCPPARDVQELLRWVRSDTPAVEAARTRLLAWDATMDAASEEAALYEAFTVHLMRRALEPLCGESWTILAGITDHDVFTYPANIIGRLLPTILRRWKAGATSMLAGKATWAEVGVAALEDAVAELDRVSARRGGRQWGRRHALTLTHPLAQAVPALGALLNPASFDLGGNWDTVMATAYNPSHPYRTTIWTPSWRQVLDLADWDRSTGVHLGGQSGQRGSPYWRDLVALWRDNRQHPLPFSDAAVAAATTATLVLEPEAAAEAPATG